jgi:hypothetical protein
MTGRRFFWGGLSRDKLTRGRVPLQSMKRRGVGVVLYSSSSPSKAVSTARPCLVIVSPPAPDYRASILPCGTLEIRTRGLDIKQRSRSWVKIGSPDKLCRVERLQGIDCVHGLRFHVPFELP